MNNHISYLIMIVTRALALGTIVYGVVALKETSTHSLIITVVIVTLYLSLDSFSGIFSKTNAVFCSAVCSTEPQLAVKTFLNNDSVSTDVQEAVRLVNEPTSEETAKAPDVPTPAETKEGFVSYGSW